jgi:hypothetical protein
VLDADIGEVDVAINDVGDDLADLAAAHFIGDETYSLEIKPVGFTQPEPFTPRDFFAIKSTVENRAHFTINMFKDS